MSLKVPEDASLLIMEAIRTGLLMGCDLRCYSNNHTPTDADDVTDYTECTFPGYADVPLNSWTSPTINVDGKAEISMTEQLFTAGSIVTPENIYGIYVTDAGGDLVYAERDPGGPVSMAVAGQQYGYLPRFTARSEF